MKPLFTLVFTGLLALPLSAQTATDTGDSAPPMGEDTAPALEILNAVDTSLGDFQWLKRPIVIFADTQADPRFQEQVELLRSRPLELLDRDVVLITDTDPAAQSEIRRKLRPRGFMLTLIAKDGRVNLRKPFPWDVREITHAIDKWPIRQQEIRDAKLRAAAEAAAAE